MLNSPPFRAILALFASSVLLSLCGCSAETPDLGIPELSVGEDDSSAKTVNGEPVREADLKLNVGVGTRFPLRKTIGQTLLQVSPSGNITSNSRLALTFAITVDKEEEGRRLLDVVYQRVQYAHDIFGDKASYDSANAPEQLPESFLVYRGLVGNGFKFWLGAKNRIVEVEGFDEFLKRTVRFAPVHRQQALLQKIVATQKDEGFSNFVDDSIGLLPYKAGALGKESRVREGDSWTKTRQIMRPLPMTVRTTYKVSELREKDATIEIVGHIFPVTSTTTAPSASVNKETITLEQGHSVGSCVIDLKTGLPLRSRVERILDMSVQTPGQAPYKQHKTITTTIEAFPTSPDTIYSETTEPGFDADQVLQTSGQREASKTSTNTGVGQAKFELEAPNR